MPRETAGREKKGAETRCDSFFGFRDDIKCHDKVFCKVVWQVEPLENSTVLRIRLKTFLLTQALQGTQAIFALVNRQPSTSLLRV